MKHSMYNTDIQDNLEMTHLLGKDTKPFAINARATIYVIVAPAPSLIHFSTSTFSVTLTGQ